MTQGLLQSTLFALGIFASSLTSTQPAPAQKIPTTEVIRETVYVVKEGDTLASIAENVYGYPEHWTTIARDNPSITDPNTVEPDTKLKLRTTPPLLVADYEAETGVGGGISFADIRQEVASADTADAVQATPPPLPQATQTPVTSGAAGPLSEEQLAYLGNCESGMTAARNSGNGYYGAFQFSPGTWRSMNTGYERADMAPLEVQKDAVQRLLQRSSIYTQFPGCARKMAAVGLL